MYLISKTLFWSPESISPFTYWRGSTRPSREGCISSHKTRGKHKVTSLLSKIRGYQTVSPIVQKPLDLAISSSMKKIPFSIHRIPIGTYEKLINIIIIITNCYKKQSTFNKNAINNCVQK